MVANMMADMEVVNKIEVGKVADIVVVMVADMEVDRVADIKSLSLLIELVL